MSTVKPTYEEISDEVHLVRKKDLGKVQGIHVAQISDGPGCNQDCGTFQSFIVNDGERRDTPGSNLEANPIPFLNHDTLLVQ